MYTKIISLNKLFLYILFNNDNNFKFHKLDFALIPTYFEIFYIFLSPIT